MDLSEYQEIQKVNRLLEESLNKERELAEEVAKLKQEKIDILKDNEKVVTIVESVDHVDIIKTLQPHDVIIRNLSYLMSGINSNMPHLHLSDYDSSGRPLVERVAEAFFKTERCEVYGQEKSVTRRGFDEVKEEVRKEFLQDLDDEFKRRADSWEAETKRLRKEVEGYKGLQEANETLILDNKRINNHYQFFKEATHNYSATLHNIGRLASQSVTFFNAKSKLRNIYKLYDESLAYHEELVKNRK